MPLPAFLLPRRMSMLPIVALAACHGPGGHTATEPIPVEVVRVAAGGQAEAAYAGVVRPRRSVSLAFKQGGRIERLLVRAGDHVRKGDPLATLGRDDATDGLDEARGEAAAANAGAAQAVDAADRSRGLDLAGALSSGDVRDRGRAALAAEGKARAAEAAVRLARRRLADDVLRASDDGEVMEAPGEVGAIVGPGTEVVRIAVGGVEAEIHVPIDADVRVGATATVRAGDAAIPALVRAIDPVADATTRQRVVHLALRSPRSLPYDALATAFFERHDAPLSIRLPQTAITVVNGIASVWQVLEDGGRVRRRTVTITGLRGADAMVSGLPGGATIVATGPEQLREGAAIRIVQVREGL